MNTPQDPGILHLTQVASNGIKGRMKKCRQVMNMNCALAVKQFFDFTLARIDTRHRFACFACFADNARLPLIEKMVNKKPAPHKQGRYHIQRYDGSGFVQCLFQIGKNVINMFDTDRQADITVRHAR
jgi:hypothetical protein